MNSYTSTICAISTPPGVGGIATARISGPEAIKIAQSIWRGKPLTECKSHSAHYGTIYDPTSGEDLDTGVATLFFAPNSFTGETVVELSVHGSRWIQRELINLLIRQGATMADRGEFTRRAVANGKLDLAEAEAVADMISSSSRAIQRIAMSHMKGHYSAHLESLRTKLLELSALVELELDFSEEDVEFANRSHLLTLANEIKEKVDSLATSFSTGQAIKNGIPIAIVGATNAGKSTLLNRILGEDKAIVSDIHGTTRDTIEDTIELSGTLFRFIDTAGLRATTDAIEKIGIERSLKSANIASLIIWVIDTSDYKNINETWQELSANIGENVPLIAVLNKTDKTQDCPILPDRISATIKLSALYDSNINPLINKIVELVAPTDFTPELTITNARHYEALTRASESTSRAINGLMSNLPGDLLAQDLRETAFHLSSITAPVTTPDLLNHIFANFCIGK
ncbi:MAG: tRNA uridine-5-carboxymethylaminomethyl(34) synthesis GTPase MnmE [Bacteroidales bacterium]|nr:tRNA uridine-5-carboxymethylaminomethyl(34) synthesis GTPase MnmE [Bacteroidales bacterium]